MKKNFFFVILLFLSAVIISIGIYFSYNSFAPLKTRSAPNSEAEIEQLSSSLVDLNNRKDKDEDGLNVLSLKRKELLIDKAKNDPSSFLRLAVLADRNSEFPQLVQANLEQIIETEGELIVIHIEGKNFNFTKTDYKLKRLSDEKIFDLNFTKTPPELQTGSKVKVKAIGIDSQLVLEAPGSTAGSTGMQTLSALTAQTAEARNSAVFMVNFSNDTSTPISQTELNSIIFANPDSVNAFYKETSYGLTSLTGQVYGWFTLSSTNAGCESNYYNWGSEADSLATASGVNLSLYTEIVYVFATPPTCSYGGLGTVGGNPGKSWIFNYQTERRAYAHEIGHNYGIHHANSFACGTKAIDVYTNCIENEYGDVFDVMGNFWYVTPNLFQLNAAHKLALGWIPQSRMNTISTPGIYQVYNSESLTSGYQILRINKPDTGESYYISYRQPLGFDSKLITSITRGASIHVWNADPVRQTKLIDTTPGIGNFSGFADAALKDTKSFDDPANNLEIIQKNHNSNFAEIEVRFTTPTPTPVIDTIPPTVNITSPLKGSLVPANTNINVTADASDNKGIGKVKFKRSGVLICTDTVAPYSCSMFTDSLANKSVTYTVSASDTSGNTTAAKVTVTTQ